MIKEGQELELALQLRVIRERLEFGAQAFASLHGVGGTVLLHLAVIRIAAIDAEEVLAHALHCHDAAHILDAQPFAYGNLLNLFGRTPAHVDAQHRAPATVHNLAQRCGKVVGRQARHKGAQLQVGCTHLVFVQQDAQRVFQCAPHFHAAHAVNGFQATLDYRLQQPVRAIRVTRMEHGEEHGGEFTLAPRPDADLLHAARQGGAGALDAVAHLGLGEVHVQIGTELQEEANLVLRGVGIDVLDARQRAELLFQHARHFFFILLRAGAGVCQKYL